MSNWTKKTLAQVARKIQSGGTPKSDNPAFYGGGIPFVSIEDITDSYKFLQATQRTLSRDGLNNCSAWLVPPRSVLYSIYATLGVPIINTIPVATSQAILGFIPDSSQINTEFLYYWLDSQRVNIVNLAGHTTQSNLSAKIVRELEILLPSLPEQTKIAETLAKVDQAIATTAALIAKHERIKTGLMQDLLSRGLDENGNLRDPQTHPFKASPLGDIPEGWDAIELDEIFKIKSGSTPSRKQNDRYFSKGHIPWVKTLDLNEGKIETTEEKITSAALMESACSVFPEGSVLVAMYGGWEQIGRTGLLACPAAVNQAISALYQSAPHVAPEYVFLALQHLRPRWKLFAASSRKDPNITRDDICRFVVPLPRTEREQQQIVEIIYSIVSQITSHQNQLSKLQILKTGLMADLLSGRVPVSALADFSL